MAFASTTSRRRTRNVLASCVVHRLRTRVSAAHQSQRGAVSGCPFASLDQKQSESLASLRAVNLGRSRDLDSRTHGTLLALQPHPQG